MRKWISRSFNRRLLACFFAVALLPVLITGIFLIQIMETMINSDYEKKIMEQSGQIGTAFSELFSGYEKAVRQISANDKIVMMIDDTDSWARSKTYTQFYKETIDYRGYAQFDIYNKNGECMFTTGSATDKDTMPTYWGILKLAGESREGLVFRREEHHVKGILLHAAGKIVDERGELKGYVVISMREKDFEKVLRESGNAQAEIAILDGFWKLIYGAHFADEDSIREKLMAGEKLFDNYHSGGMLITPIENAGLYMVMVCPEVFSGDMLPTMYSVLFVMLAGSILLCLFMSARLSRSLTLPIKRMNKAMHSLQEGDLSVRIPMEREDELGQMSQNFNIMANELAEHMEEKVRKQKELNDSHIAMMQAQLNPHFLYNTLDTMKWVAKANRIPEIATMAAGLAKILRTSISGESMICLKEEMELVSCYIDIQRIRFYDKFRYFADVEDGLLECIVPKLLVQPIVENAVLHGLEECEEGSITVKVWKKEERLMIGVTDDGCGISDEIMEHLNSRDREKLAGHIGFLNVDTIIRLTYGEDYGLHVDKPENGGTRITMTLPIRYAWEQGEQNV